MAATNVRVSFNQQIHRFTLLQSPDSTRPINLSALCDALVKHLGLPCAPDQLSNPSTAPLHIWYLDTDEIYRHVKDDQTLQQALSQSPDLIHLRLLHPKPSMMNNSSSTDIPDDSSEQNEQEQTVGEEELEEQAVVEEEDDDDDDEQVDDEDEDPVSMAPSSTKLIVRANLPILLKIYHHLHTYASPPVLQSLDALSDMIDTRRDDAVALRDGRHHFAKLFSSFLHHLNTRAPDYRVSKPLHEQLVSRFDDIASQIELSKDMISAIHRAIRSVVNCRFAMTLVRNKYTELVPDDISPTPNDSNNDTTPSALIADSSANGGRSKKKRRKHPHLPRRPVKHYSRHLDRLILVASDDVKLFYSRLVRYQKRLEARGLEFPEWSTELCHSIERATFNVARKHARLSCKRKKNYVIDDEKVTALASYVAKKLAREEFPIKYADKAGQLAEMMACDDNIVNMVVVWSKKKLLKIIRKENDEVHYSISNSASSLIKNDEKKKKRVMTNKNMKHKNSSKDYSIGSGDVMRSSRVTDLSGDASRKTNSSLQSHHSLLKSDFRSRSRSRSRSGNRSNQNDIVNSPKSLDDDEFAFRADLDRNPFVDSPKSQARNNPDGSVGAASSARSVRQGYIPELNLLDKHQDDFLDEEFDDDFDDDFDDLGNEQDDIDLEAALRRRYGIVVDGTDDEGDDDDDVSDDTSLSKWARVEMEKEHFSALSTANGNGLDSNGGMDFDGGQEPWRRSPARRERRDRQPSPRPPHHDGISVDRASGSLTGGRRNGSNPRSEGSAVRGISDHASESRHLGGAMGQDMRISRQMQATKDSLAGGSTRGADIVNGHGMGMRMMDMDGTGTSRTDNIDNESEEGVSVATNETVHSGAYELGGNGIANSNGVGHGVYEPIGGSGGGRGEFEEDDWDGDAIHGGMQNGHADSELWMSSHAPYQHHSRSSYKDPTPVWQ